MQITSKSFISGALLSFVGYASSFAIVVKGLSQMGASAEQTISGLMVLSIMMGLCGIILSIKCKMPISVAWSTPGVAFLISSITPLGGFNEAVGAFIMSSVLIILSGFFKPLSKLASSIPKSIANAMLAGVLLPLCLAPFQLIDQLPIIGAVVVLTWLVVGKIRKVLAVPSAVIAAMLAIYFLMDADWSSVKFAWHVPELVVPVFTVSSFISITIPLYIITMASQNITGLAVLKTFDYHPNAGVMFRWTGFFSLIASPFGGHAINLAALTAAMCASEDGGDNPAYRYWSAVIAGVIYIIFGLLSVMAVAFISLSPPIIIAAVAGLALFSAMANAMVSALAEVQERELALITFLISASGLSFFNIAGAFWGMLVGVLLYLLNKPRYQ